MVSAAVMRRLHRQFRGRAKATDVLSFDLGSAAQIVICRDVARRQARQRGLTFSQEVFRLLVHGIAHVAGFQHDTLRHFAQMRRAEFAVLLKELP